MNVFSSSFQRLFFLVAILFILGFGCDFLANSSSPFDFGLGYSDDSVLAAMIDDYAGHPDDPRLPAESIGASDEVLEATDLRELANVVNSGIGFALENVEKEPRFLFALGRAAEVLGYYEKSFLWLEEAAENGSAAAWAQLAYSYSYDEEYTTAREYIQNATDGGFNNEETAYFLEQLDAIESFNDFGRRDWIEAFYKKDLSALSPNSITEKYVLNYYVGKIQNTLWSNDILFLIEDTSIFLELDPLVSAKFGVWSKTVDENGGSDFARYGVFGDEYRLIADQATQDARRLAMLYEFSPNFFLKVYEGIKIYAQ